MAGTRHRQIRNAAVAALSAIMPALADGGVIPGRRGRPVPEQFKRQVHVYLDASTIERAEFSGQPDDWMTRLRIECAARANAGQTGEDNADDLANEIYAALMADPSLGGLAMDLVPLGINWDTEEADASLGVTQLAFDAKHRTPANSISA
ncbi:phage tail terminator protein [Polaromonas sp.]|uniref:phage tail terminator protein n=1 Tax=Polaromonas sp. TaxID=1869339 RepID=UPI003562193F